MDERALLAALAQISASVPPGSIEETKLAVMKFLQNPAFLQQAQQQQQQQQAQNVVQNENYNLVQNALASNVPTLDVPTISSYLGYNPPPAPKDEPKDLPAKYQKLLDTIEEMSKSCFPIYLSFF